MKRFIQIFLLFSLTIIISGCGRSSTLVTDDGIERTEILFMHNIERAKDKADALQISPELTKTAQLWAESMAQRGRLQHGKTYIHPEFPYCAENIAWGQKTIDKVMNGWMNSSGHRTNILNKKYTHAGFGYARMSDGSPYWCAQFGGK